MLIIPGPTSASDPLWIKLVFAALTLTLLVIAMRRWWKDRR